MQITNLFKKKEQKEEPINLPQTPVRDEKGRFVSKRKLENKLKKVKEEKPKKEETLEPLVVTFLAKK